MSIYGAKEYQFAEPFARGLALNAGFRSWVLSRTKLAQYSACAVLLQNEMSQRRAKGAATWWRSHWHSKCECSGCRGGQETDLLAVFGTPEGYRFALHVEVKQPSDHFPAHKDQAANYAVRANCWAQSPPLAVVPHQAATTALLCSSGKLGRFAPHLPKFGAVFTFEQISAEFETLYPREVAYAS